MSRRRFDEEDDYRDGPPRKGTTPAVWIVLGVCVVFVGVAAVGCLGYLFWAGGAAPRPAPPATVAGPAKKVYTRNELKTLLMGKSSDDVLKLLGTPQETTDLGHAKIWVYHRVSRDPTNGQTDVSAAVRLEDGRVTMVVF